MIKIKTGLTIIMYILVTFLTIKFITQNKLPLAWDQSGYLDVSVQIGHAIIKHDLLKVGKIFIWHEPWSNRPAMFMLVAGIFAALTNFNVNLIIILSNMVWVGLIIYCAYQLSEQMNRGSGVLSVFLILSSYSVIFLYRDFLNEFALVGGVILVEYLFFKSQKLLSTKYSICTFFAIIFGALTKETFILYIFPLFLYSTYQISYNKLYKSKQSYLNYVLVYIGSFFIILFFYFPIITPLLKNIFDNVGNSVGQFYARPYFKGSINYYLVYFYSLSFVTSLLYLIIPVVAYCFNLLITQKYLKLLEFNETRFLVFGLIFSPILILTIFITDTDFRFIIPILPLVLICCAKLTTTLPKNIEKVVLCLLVGVGLVNLWSSQYKIKFLPNHIYIHNLIIFNQTYDASSLGGIRYGYQGIDSNYSSSIEKLFNFLTKENCNNCKIAVLVATPQLNVVTFNSYATLKSSNFKFYGIAESKDLKFYNYVVRLDKGNQNYDPKVKNLLIDKTNDYISQEVQTKNLKISKKILLPNNTSLDIIKIMSLPKILWWGDFSGPVNWNLKI